MKATLSRAKTDPRVDAYLQEAEAFAKPILGHVRALVHAGCPEAEETIKWNRPTFVYRRKMLCNMAAFKAHCSLGFWPPGVAAMIARDSHGQAGDSSGQFGRITSLADLPDDATLRGYLAGAIQILDGGGPAIPRPAAKPRRPEIPLPADFAEILKRHPAAGTTFENLSPSHRREYLEWIVGAKREETRARRMATAVGWLAAGKTKEWKYQA